MVRKAIKKLSNRFTGQKMFLPEVTRKQGQGEDELGKNKVSPSGKKSKGDGLEMMYVRTS